MYKKQSVRENGTLAYFREKLQRRNVGVDVKHYEHCEQFFVSIGKCYLIEALLEFFELENTADKPICLLIHKDLSVEEVKEKYVNAIDKFVEEYFLNTSLFPNDDGILHYALNILHYYLLLVDIKDAVSTGNGAYLATIHKQMLLHFFSSPGFNAYAIEMLINVIQNEVLLSEAEAHQSKFAATANWHGGHGKNVEIDLFQENRNRDIKEMIKSMGSNKTDKAIGRASKASSGIRLIIEAFDKQSGVHVSSSSHSHRASDEDEEKICADLRSVRPYNHVPERKHNSFQNINANELHDLDKQKFRDWLSKHKRNIVMHFPCEEDDEDNDGNEDNDGDEYDDN